MAGAGRDYGSLRPFRSRARGSTVKRLILLVAALSLPLLAACEPPPGSRPCTNIDAGSGFWDGSLVTFTINLLDRPCEDIRYKMFVDDSERGPLLATATYQGTNNDPTFRVDYAVTVTDDDTEICLHHETIAADGQRLDRAPDVGCAVWVANEPPTGRRYR